MNTLQFDSFTSIEYTGSLDVECIDVTLDDRLKGLIQKAQEFLKENPKASYVAVTLNDDDYQIEFPEDSESKYYPPLVILNIHRGYLTLELMDEYSWMESDRLYLE